MPKRTEKSPITDQMILDGSDNVSVRVAAAYLCTCADTLSRMLHKGLCPFGISVIDEQTKTWRYLIPKEALVKYKHGQLAIADVRGLAEEVDRRLDNRLRHMQGYVPDL